jgi:NADH:ubiquinone oxidoreductase subunit E
VEPDAILATLEIKPDAEDGLIAILERIQAKYNYLPADALRKVAEVTGRSLVDVYGVATFYRSFSLKPRGKHLVSVCLGTACHVRRGAEVAHEFERQLGVDPGETTPDKEFTLETVNCLGACALGPIAVIDGHYFSKMEKPKVREVLNKARIGLDASDDDSDHRIIPLDAACPRCNRSLMDTDHLLDGRPSIRVTGAFGDKHGWVCLSSLYGSYAVSSEHEAPEDTVVHFFCPHCHGELLGAAKCADCGAPMVPMSVRGGGMVHICTRRGCRGHMLDLNGVNF